ncbi:von Willebrand factor A domain-containing protein 5A isoform X1 [Lutra lutra]|uniref:von Willebrand factor A domain-containing protein 5A isoform X1 n=1 Tax=Lutra lutra TaxID=9657 RepID=UPI001FD0A682|nr:von Willebrand factor A domain-containing protein 5A isoform X1 [Lutra lutra]XP_047547927.1 von Willebrand factor A domain-containing protein 5A isoform X1 [Lutra lutra]XP_047547928.1 von Willebrand factor A domain-containing protein 5A isoform X1 [Lutra lutra]XP_047547929.1 von Willebrand factor A domain-containing protein 5A isoform X1 [Lutra lutra]XP_047547930.1 von Willebrand factor A domain-containing protein 5A isoform X1 [Lutra lutra]
MVLQGGLLTRREEPVPLKSISVTLSIREFVAGVSATLNYKNEEEVPLETFFVFPMDDDSAVYSFEAEMDGEKIKAELKEKAKAHSIYESAISNRRQAFLLEEDKYSKDVFCCSVGNLNPGSSVALTLKYVQELPLEADGALRYVLPAVLNPRYRGSGSFEDSCLDMKTPVVPLEDLPYTLSMVATISSQHGIERVQSNCPFSPTKYLGEDKTSAQVSLADGHKFDRDVELLIYYSEVHTPTVAVEMGQPRDNSDGFMKDPSAMVCFYPNIPETQSLVISGEFIFLMDRSGSMQSPISKQDNSQLRIEAAKETLILLLKSLPMGCYFNIYGFGSSYEAFFPNSVKYTQQTMEEALRRVKLMQANLGGTEILTPLQIIYGQPPVEGHPLQLFVFTDGEVADTFNIINEVKRNRLRHRCFSFGIGEGASTSLIKGIARVAGGTSEFITGKDRMQSKALRALKYALQPAVEDVSVTWELPAKLSAKMLSPEQTVLYKGQRLIVYALLSGTMPPAEATGEVYLKYTFQGKSFDNRVTFSLQPKPDDNFTIHRLAAKSFLHAKDMGFRDTPANDKKDVLKISIDCGVISSQTAFVAVSENSNKPVQGPLACRDIPRPVLLGAASVMPQHCACGAPPSFMCLRSVSPAPRRNHYKGMSNQQDGCKPCGPMINKDLCALETSPQMEGACYATQSTNLETHCAVFGENHLVQLISLQNADGSWCLDENLAGILGKSLEDLQAAVPVKDASSLSWATVLAVVWLHSNAIQMKGEWELLEKKARDWIHIHAASIMQELVKAAIALIKSSVDPAIFAI